MHCRVIKKITKIYYYYLKRSEKELEVGPSKLIKSVYNKEF